MFHGGRNMMLIGLCLTDCERVAESYAGRNGGEVLTADVDLDSLTVLELDEGYDRDADRAPGDTAADCARYAAQGVDVIVFTDEDPRGREHTTWRIVSARGLAAVSLTEEE
jgi:hypothetical protein